MKTVNLVGKRFFALVTRKGGSFRTIYALRVYEFNAKGVPHNVDTAMHIVANKSQYAALGRLTALCGYVSGRPTVARMNELTDEQLTKLVS